MVSMTFGFIEAFVYHLSHQIMHYNDPHLEVTALRTIPHGKSCVAGCNTPQLLQHKRRSILSSTTTVPSKQKDNQETATQKIKTIMPNSLIAATTTIKADFPKRRTLFATTPWHNEQNSSWVSGEFLSLSFLQWRDSDQRKQMMLMRLHILEKPNKEL